MKVLCRPEAGMAKVVPLETRVGINCGSSEKELKQKWKRNGKEKETKEWQTEGSESWGRGGLRSEDNTGR